MRVVLAMYDHSYLDALAVRLKVQDTAHSLIKRPVRLNNVVMYLGH